MSWSTRYWSESEFLGARAEWAALLARSHADPLFCSWEWLARWWRHHQKECSLELRMLAVYREGRLRGIAPLHERVVSIGGIARLRRRELLGNVWRDPRAVMSELVDFIVDGEDQPGVTMQLVAALAGDGQWDELVAPHGRADGVAAGCLRRLAQQRAAYLRDTDAMPIYSIPAGGGFSAYVQSLGPGTRRRLVGQRGGRLCSLEFATTESLHDYMRELGVFLAQRWGRPSWSGTRLALHAEFAEEMAGIGALRLSRLIADGRVISILYNVVAGNREYNIQSAFQAGSPPAKSPGYLHLGYSLERAFADGLSSYELLAGQGKKTDYKAALAGRRDTVSTLHLVRHRFWRHIYRAWDRLRARRQSS
jgi:hypothetical protein